MKTNRHFHLFVLLILIPISLPAQVSLITNLNGVNDGVSTYVNGDAEELNGSLLFPGNGFSANLYVSDGTAEGTRYLRDSNGRVISAVSGFTKLDSLVIFSGQVDRLQSIYRTNGTPEGTYALTDFHFYTILCTTRIGDKVFFHGRTSDAQSELWMTDGSPEGTINITDANGNYIEFPCGFVEFEGKAFFSAQISGFGQELFVSDGTNEGTYMIKDINPGPNGGFNNAMIVFNEKLFITANDGEHGHEFWTSDGTEEGTILFIDLLPGNAGSIPFGFIIDGDLIFSARDADRGRELWKTDGTPEGTVFFSDINPGSASSSPSYLFNLGSRGYLAYGSNIEHGRELFLIDQEGNARLVRDIRPGSSGSSTSYFYEYNGIIFFDANDGEHGNELWRTDGSTEGTYMVEDIEDGPGSSRPERLNVLEDGFYFSAYTSDLGRELYWYTDITNSDLMICSRIFLQGAYDPSTGLMRDDLRTTSTLPLTEPFTDLGYIHMEGGGEHIEQVVLEMEGGNAIVDWVFLELRDKTDAGAVVATRSALLQRDGDIVDIDGASPVIFAQQPMDDYYLAVKHRNHLGAMIAMPVPLSGTTTLVDFTTEINGILGGSNGIASLPDGKLGLYCGDYDRNGQIQNTDYNFMAPNLGTAGYLPGDFDLNGQVQNTDLQLKLAPNIGKGQAF